MYVGLEGRRSHWSACSYIRRIKSTPDPDAFELKSIMVHLPFLSRCCCEGIVKVCSWQKVLHTQQICIMLRL